MPVYLVVDASVVRSAGGSNQINPQSVACTQFLDLILKERCYVVLTPEILEEWKNHKSKFSGNWLRRVYGRKLVKQVTVPKNEQLFDRICNYLNEPSRKDAVEKDMLIVEAANQYDNKVASLDDRMRTILASVSPHIHEIGVIV